MRQSEMEFSIDDRTLSKELGIPVVPTSARQGEGMNELLNTIHDVATGKYICKPYRIKTSSSELNSAIEKLSREIEVEYPNLPNLRWVALRLLEGDQSIIDAIRNGDLGNLKKDVNLSEVEV
jgi:Fe2+ transport system protein B